MEKKRRIYVVALLGLMLVVATAGVGFAINYYGQVANTDNEVEPEYLLVSIDGNENGTYDEAADFTTGFQGAIAFNTVRTVSTVTWTYADGVATETVDGHVCASLGSVTVKVTPSADTKTFTLNMIRTAGTMSNDATFYAVVGSDEVEMSTETFTFTGLSAQSSDPEEVQISLYAYMDLSQYDDDDFPPTELLHGVTFTYTATATL